MKRPNLEVVRLIQERGGIVIVDSTRRGKSLPDALSKTIPIWCAVLTQASRRKHNEPVPLEDVSDTAGLCSQSCDIFRDVVKGPSGLLSPTHQVPPSEHAQMEQRIGGWVESLLASDLPVPRLAKPLVPLFLTRPEDNGTESALLDSLSSWKHSDEIYPVIVVSASKRVDLPLPSSDGSFYYTQGSGDDEELWSHGLTPDMFWHGPTHERLMSTPREELAEEIRAVVRERKDNDLLVSLADLSLTKQQDGDVCLRESPLYCGLRSPDTKAFPSAYDLVVQLNRVASDEEGGDGTGTESNSRVRRYAVPEGKKGLNSFRAALPHILKLVRENLYDKNTGLCRDREGTKILFVDSKLSDGLLATQVAILSAFFTAQDHAAAPTLLPSLDEVSQHNATLTKEDVRKRLQWIQRDLPTANPSRAHMLRINEVLLSQRVLDSVKLHGGGYHLNL